MNQENFYIADFIMNLPAGSLIFSSTFFFCSMRAQCGYNDCLFLNRLI